MYTLKSAAKMLGVSLSTIHRWVAASNVEKTLVQTDQRRVYLAYNDIVALADKYRPLKMQVEGQEKPKQDMTGLYSVWDVAKLLGMGYCTVGKWIASAKIEKQFIMTDRRRVYIGYSDLVKLASEHNRTIAYDALKKEQESNGQEDADLGEDKLYSMAEAALFLGVTEATVRKWMMFYHIEEEKVESDKKRIYIAYRDMVMLANIKKGGSGYSPNLGNDIKEIRYRLDMLDEHISNLEKYIKRSIYIP